MRNKWEKYSFEKWAQHLDQWFSNFFAAEPFYITGEITELLFKIMLITITEMFCLTKLMSWRPIFFIWRLTAYRNAILEYIPKIGNYVWKSLRNCLRK